MTQANLFDLKSADYKISFSTSSLDGRPHFSYTKGKVTKNFVGDQIKQEETAIGNLISVVLKSVPDLQTVVLSVLLPQVNIPHDKDSINFKTEGIVTTIKTSIAGPKLVSGAVQSYKYSVLRGVAKAVFF